MLSHGHATWAASNPQPFPHFQVGIPLVASALAGTDVPSIINGRVSLFACQVNAMGTTLDGSISMATSSWSSNADVLANIMVSDQIACFTTNTFYNVFRGECLGGRGGRVPTRRHALLIHITTLLFLSTPPSSPQARPTLTAATAPTTPRCAPRT